MSDHLPKYYISKRSPTSIRPWHVFRTERRLHPSGRLWGQFVDNFPTLEAAMNRIYPPSRIINGAPPWPIDKG